MQERLTTLSGVLPEGILPQMTPPASIMGQIVVAGIYRQQGPNDGELYPIGKTGLVAELAGGNDQEHDLIVWDPIDRHHVDKWEQISPTKVTWTSSSVEPRRTDEERSATITIDGKQHAVSFPTESSRQLSLRTIADWVIRPRILKVTGVAEAFILGGDKKQFRYGLIRQHYWNTT